MTSPTSVVILARRCGLAPPQWVHPDSPARFADFALATAEAEAEAEAEAASERVANWLSFDGLGATAWRWCILTPIASGRPLDLASLVRCLDHMTAAHVLAYAAIKECLPEARLAMTAGVTGIYELDRLVLDILLARSAGVDRFEMGPWLAGRRSAFNTATPPPRGRIGTVLRAGVGAAIAGERALPTAVSAVYASPYARTIDGVER